MKYQAKQKHLLPFHDTKLKEIHINNMNYKKIKMGNKVKNVNMKSRTYYFLNDIDIENSDPNNI